MSFRTKYGHYEFLVMSFGIINDSATFMNLMNRVFQNYLDSFVIVFIYYILVYSKSDNEHVSHLWIVLQVLKEHHLFAKYNKFKFCLRSIDFLGHMYLVWALMLILRRRRWLRVFLDL